MRNRIEDLPYLFPVKFRFIGPCCFRGEFFFLFLKSTNEKHELPMAAIFINGSGLNEQYLNIYLSVDMIFQSLCFPARFS